MAQDTKRHAPKARPQHPKRRETKRPGVDKRAWIVLSALLVAGVLAGFALIGRGNSESGELVGGLPAASDYHSLFVDPEHGNALLLGTHEGLFRSTDGGSTWRLEELPGQDAMNLAGPGSSPLWAAGHDVLARSTDGGSTWLDVRPTGLPSLDVHGFAVDPVEPQRIFAAVAGAGLFGSDDEGASFRPVSSEVGANVMALAVAKGGRLLAGDMQQGLLSSADGGETWSKVHDAQVMGLAVSPKDADHVLAGGQGVLLSTDGATSWRRVLDVPEGVGPVAWSASDPTVAYAVGFDRTLYRTDDGGETWAPAAGGAR